MSKFLLFLRILFVTVRVLFVVAILGAVAFYVLVMSMPSWE